MIQVLHLSSRWNKFLASLFISIQSIVSVSGRTSPQFWDVFHKPTTSLLFSLLVFQQLRSTLLLKMLFKLNWDRRCCFLLHSFDSILTFVPEALWCCSLRPIILFCQDHVQFLPFVVGVLPELHHSYSFSKWSSTFFSKGAQAFFILQSGVQFFLPYYWRWYYVILDNVSSCFMIHMLLRMRYFKSINLFVGVILCHVSPKAFPKDCCYLWCL